MCPVSLGEAQAPGGPGVVLVRVDVEVPGSDQVVVTSADGSRTETHAIAFTRTDTASLSDRAWVSATSGWNGVNRDASVEGKPLTLGRAAGATLYPKGAGARAVSQIVYVCLGST